MTPVSGVEIVGAVLAVALGASLGSFAGVALDRVPRGQSLGGRSHCVCGAPIAARDNVPVLGFLLRGGRARCCDARIPWWILGVEVAGAVVALAVYLAAV
jgi:prepilin signal peptidase PulO-like enzyme (type II secretory pathway)